MKAAAGGSAAPLTCVPSPALSQAWLALGVGGLLSFNLIFPSDQPDIARLLGVSRRRRRRACGQAGGQRHGGTPSASMVCQQCGQWLQQGRLIGPG